MDEHRLSRLLLAASCGVMALLAAGCWDEGYDDPPAGPPAAAWVSIDDRATKVETATAWLEGEAECPGCFASDWQYGSCPVIECPSASGMDVSWTNTTTGASGAATHGIVPACHCPWPWGYGYCYTACNHVWWVSVPLVPGDNDIVIGATAPGFAPGSDSMLIQRVPPTPSWLAPLAGAGEVTLAWTATENATSYNLYWSTTPYGWAALCTKVADVDSPYTLGGLAGGVPHYFFVTALAGAAEGFDSQRLEVTPQ